VTRDIFIWWLTAQAFGLAGLPLTRFVFRALPDRGYAFGKSLGLLLSGYLAWLLAMLGLAPFGRGLLVICALAVGAIGLFIAKDHRPPTTDDKASTSGKFSILNSQFSIPADWRRILCYEIVFALALIFVALLRSYNPDPWGTERPMDYALFNAIRGSTAFPPHDPWLAGYSINYYYFGYLLMAAVSLVSGIEQGVAYNLSLALLFALTALGVAGVVMNLIELTDEGRRTKDEARRRGFRPSSFVFGQALAVLLAVVLVLFAGNQGGALEIVTGLESPLAMDVRDLARAVQNGLGKRAALDLQYPYKEWGAQAITSVLTPTDMVANFNWWNPSRAVWDIARDPGDPTKYYAITEFPFFSFWLGDMHPHVMALPFGLLALALALQTIARPAAPNFAQGRRGWAELGLTGIILGSLYTINSWDFPTYVLLFLGALLLLYVRLGHRGPMPENSSLVTRHSSLLNVWWRHLAPQAIMALLAAWLLFAPFYLTFRSLVGGKEPLIGLPILSTLTRTIGFVTWTKTPLHSFLIIFGLSLVPLVAYVIAQSRLLIQPSELPSVAPAEDVIDVTDDEGRTTNASTATLRRLDQHNADGLQGFAARLGTPLSWRYLPLALLAVLLLGTAVGFPLLVLLALAICAARLAIMRAAQPAEAFVLWTFALVCLICFGTELIYIRDGFEGGSSRMNTIFKFYYQAWLIWGVLAGYALWWLVAVFLRTKNQEPRTKRRQLPHAGSQFLVLSSLILFVALLAGALVYPWLTAGKSFRDGQRIGLDGKTPPEHTPEGAAAIAWLRENATGDAVILEAVGGDYNGNGGSAVSASTGLATVLGWPGHEQQWRGGDPPSYAQIDLRSADVTEIYSGTDTTKAAELLKKYKVNYIYVGAVEQSAYAQLDPNKLAQLGEQVFQQGNVTIYRVP